MKRLKDQSLYRIDCCQEMLKLTRYVKLAVLMTKMHKSFEIVRALEKCYHQPLSLLFFILL